MLYDTYDTFVGNVEVFFNIHSIHLGMSPYYDARLWRENALGQERRRGLVMYVEEGLISPQPGGR